ncbi:MAG: glycosyltransferase 87 family protein [Chloroflexi bacterium]|nr:glycosyltransferase 87 family protein [Chloroflexota bacterium]
MKARPYTALVLILGLALRAVLVPLTHGPDFVVWDLASRYTLAGVNIYRDHPPYPGGPYTYFPLFLYLELPFQWLALHGGAPFVVLGKLPIIAGDLLTGALLAHILARRGCRDAVVALGVALYVLNPLVLYNGAFYGRFDTLCAGLLLLALLVHDANAFRMRHWAFPLLYALAVATKTYPIFLLPWLLTREPWGRRRLLLALVAVLGGLSLPYLLTSPARFVADVLLYNANKLPGHLSWQVLLLGVLPPLAARVVSYLLLALLVAALYSYRRLDLWTYATVAILLFILLSKVVIEQYLLWPLPFLIVDTVRYRSWASGALLTLLSATGMLVNPYIYPFGASPTPIAVVLDMAILLYIWTRTRRPDLKRSGLPGAPSPYDVTPFSR